MTAVLDPRVIRELARDCGFELAGVAPAQPVPDAAWYRQWVADGFAGGMRYLTDRRAAVRDDPRNLLASARSVICVGKLYQTPWPYSTRFDDRERAWISRYAWGSDYHDIIRGGLERLTRRLQERAGVPFESKICVDTAPLLERSYARRAGLGWIGKNTCLIHQPSGSWFFLGELLVSLEIESAEAPPPDRCGTCTRCIDACPTQAIVPAASHYAVDSRLCISYFTIELRGTMPEKQRSALGNHVFGCDICQDVCPWNRRAPMTSEPGFEPRDFAPSLERLAAITEEEFRSMFRGSPVTRSRYSGFLRNVAVAMGNTKLEKFRAPLEQLVAAEDPVVAEHARWALQQVRHNDSMRNVDTSLYDSDFYLWTQRAAEQLRSGTLAEDDRRYAAEEISDMGTRDRRELQSRMIVLVTHLIQWAAQPHLRETSTWLATINAQRTQIEGLLEQSPSLRACLVVELVSIYTKAVKQAAIETRIPLSDLQGKLESGKPLPADLLLSADFLPEQPGDLVSRTGA